MNLPRILLRNSTFFLLEATSCKATLAGRLRRSISATLASSWPLTCCATRRRLAPILADIRPTARTSTTTAPPPPNAATAVRRAQAELSLVLLFGRRPSRSIAKLQPLSALTALARFRPSASATRTGVDWAPDFGAARRPSGGELIRRRPTRRMTKRSNGRGGQMATDSNEEFLASFCSFPHPNSVPRGELVDLAPSRQPTAPPGETSGRREMIGQLSHARDKSLYDTIALEALACCPQIARNGRGMDLESERPDRRRLRSEFESTSLVQFRIPSSIRCKKSPPER